MLFDATFKNICFYDMCSVRNRNMANSPLQGTHFLHGVSSCCLGRLT